MSSNAFIGVIGRLIEAPVIVVHIIGRKNWKATRKDGIRRDLYILKGVGGDSYSITMPVHNAIKVGEEFVVKGTIQKHSMFNGQRQTHLVAYSLKMKQAKRI